MTNEINTNTRPLRRNADLTWSAAGKAPCEFCSIQSACELEDGVASVVCRDTVPALSFQDEVGLSHLANTFRVGRAWEARLRTGDRVGLYNTITKQIFGYARVLSIAAGPIGAILRDHAHANHLLLSDPPETAPRTLATWLRRQYGPRIVNPDTKLTAIYLLRSPGEK